MKLAIMQPYFFPYLGYFQLIHAVDRFVIYDDVQYQKGGWLNRNYILLQNVARWITLEAHGASPNKRIKDVKVGSNQGKILKTIYYAYARAPYFDEVYPLLESCLMQNDANLAIYLETTIKLICEYLELETNFYRSSEINQSDDCRGQERVLKICRERKATHYINLPGGEKLYDREVFQSNGIDLSYIQPALSPYKQFGNQFIPRLSIIDVLMFNDRSRCQEMLGEYRLA